MIPIAKANITGIAPVVVPVIKESLTTVVALKCQHPNATTMHNNPAMIPTFSPRL
jgi:hypothetical protein